jgi:hypothetical protein
MNLLKSTSYVTDRGEVFTPAWMVQVMLDLVTVSEIASHGHASKEPDS